MVQVNDHYERQTLGEEEEADESFAPVGSDSGVDMSRGGSLAFREDEKASAGKEVHGTKRGRESSKSSTGEDTDEPPNKKQLRLGRSEIAERYRAIYSAFLLELSEIKRNVEGQTASVNKALDEANLNLQVSEQKRAEQEKAYLEKKKKYDKAEAVTQDALKSLKWLEQRKGLEGTIIMTLSARTIVKKFAANAQIAGVAEAQQKARKDAADEEAKKAGDEVEKTKERSEHEKGTLEKSAKETTEAEAFVLDKLNSGLVQNWLK